MRTNMFTKYAAVKLALALFTNYATETNAVRLGDVTNADNGVQHFTLSTAAKNLNNRTQTVTFDVVEIDPTKAKLRAATFPGEERNVIPFTDREDHQGLHKLSEIVEAQNKEIRREQGASGEILAAINGGFFNMVHKRTEAPRDYKDEICPLEGE